MKSVKLNYIYNISYQILLVLAPLVTTAYISRVLGADGVGVYSYSSSIVSYFTLFAGFGTSGFGKREISYLQNDAYNRSIVFWGTELISIALTSVCLVLYMIFICFQDDKLIYVILIANILSVALDVTWVFQGLEEYGTIVFRNFVFKFLSIVYVFAFVKDKRDIYLYVLGLGLSTALGNASLWFQLPKYLVRVPLKVVLAKFDFKRNFKEITTLFIPTIAVQIYTVFDKTMIGIVTKDSFENGYYEQAEKVVKIALAVVTSLATVAASRIGSLYSENKKDEISVYMYKSYNFAWFLGIAIMFGIIGVSNNLVPWFWGEGFDKVAPLLKILSVLAISIGINNITSLQYLIPTKRQNLFTKTVIMGAVINFCGNLLLIPCMKSVGAAIATVVSETSIAVVQVILIKDEISPIKILKLSKNYLISGMIMLGALSIMDSILGSSFINTFIMIATGASIYFLSLLILRDCFFCDLAWSTISKLKNIGNKLKH